jgi:hypothetical protein
MATTMAAKLRWSEGMAQGMATQVEHNSIRTKRNKPMTMEPQDVTQQLQIIVLQNKVLEATLLEKKNLEQQLENEQSQRKDLQERLLVEVHELDQHANSSMCTSLLRGFASSSLN